MKDVIIQPINYNADNMDAIVYSIERALYKSVNSVNENKHFDRKSNTLDRTESMHDYLHSIRRKNHVILAITKLKIVNWFDRNEAYGFTFEDSICMVSTNLIYGNEEYFPEDVKNITESLSILSVHEIGHANGLEHHKMKKTRNGKFCNMYVTSSISEVHIENGKNLLLRDTEYCDDCYKILKM